MTKQQAEKLIALTSHPGWQAFLEYKQERLDKCHEVLEWAKDGELIKTQGAVLEIREDMGLQKKALDMLNGV